MNTDKKKYTLDIFGEQYSMVSDEQEQVVQKAALRVDGCMREIHMQGIRDSKKVALLTALRIAILLENEQERAIMLRTKEEAVVRRLDQELMSLL